MRTEFTTKSGGMRFSKSENGVETIIYDTEIEKLKKKLEFENQLESEKK